MTLSQKINAVATRTNAQAYNNTSEKFIFCIDLLEISAHSRLADVAVNELEDKFETLLQKVA